MKIFIKGLLIFNPLSTTLQICQTRKFHPLHQGITNMFAMACIKVIKAVLFRAMLKQSDIMGHLLQLGLCTVFKFNQIYFWLLFDWLLSLKIYQNHSVVIPSYWDFFLF
jgi:hypothetical protein